MPIRNREAAKTFAPEISFAALLLVIFSFQLILGIVEYPMQAEALAEFISQEFGVNEGDVRTAVEPHLLRSAQRRTAILTAPLFAAVVFSWYRIYKRNRVLSKDSAEHLSG